MKLLDRFDLEQPVQRTGDVLLHPLYGHDRRHDGPPVAVEEHLLADGWLERVLGLPEILASRIAQLIPEPHRGKVTSRTPW